MKVTVSVGGTFHAFRLAEQLDARGLLHRLVTTHRPLRGERITPERIVANIVPEVLMRGPRVLGLPWRVGDYLKVATFDRWASRYVDGCDVWVGFAAFSLVSLRAARAAGARTVLERGSTHILTQQALVADEYRRWRCPAPSIDRRLLDRQLREYEEAEYICVPSRFALQSFRDHGVLDDRLLLVPYGVDRTLFSPGPQTPGRPFRILAVGLSLRKGTPYLLEAVARLNVPEVELWLAGTAAPDVAPVLRRSPVPFRHLGALSHRDLAAVYRSASVFVAPSVEEGMGLSVLEALSSGLPVVATEHTGALDIFTNGREGFIIPPRDPAALSGALLRLYEDEGLRRSMAQTAALTAGGWTWERYGDRIASTYGNLLAHPAAARGGPFVL